MPFPFRTHWWRKIQYLGLDKQYGKKDYEISHFLKDIFGLSPLPPAEVSYCFAFEFTVKPRFTNASNHDQFGLRTNFPNTKRLG